MKIIPYVSQNIKHFSDPSYIHQLIRDAPIKKFEDRTVQSMIRIIRTVDDTTTDEKKAWIIDMLEEAALSKIEPVATTVNRGETFAIRLHLSEGDDFSGHNLLARHASDLSSLTSESLLGDTYENDPVQEVTFVDYSQPSGDFIKVFVLLETSDSNDVATGDATSVLVTAYIYCRENVDLEDN